MPKAIVRIKKLDMGMLRWAARFDPYIIETEETTLEVMRACTQLGIQLFVVRQKTDGFSTEFQEFFNARPKPNPDATAGGKDAPQLGVRIFFDQSDPSELLAKSEEEINQILSNVAIKIHACMSKKEENPSDVVNLREIGAAQAPKHAEKSLMDDEAFIQKIALSLVRSGYMRGQTYSNCLKMADWHPDMAKVIHQEMSEPIGTYAHQQIFERAVAHLSKAGSMANGF